MDWGRLARYVVHARAQRDWSQDDLARAAGLKQATVSAIETAKGKTRAATLGKIERALAWKPGSAQSILAGGEPTPASSPETPRVGWTTPPTSDELRRASGLAIPVQHESRQDITSAAP